MATLIQRTSPEPALAVPAAGTPTNTALHRTVAAFGVLAALAGIEHGAGEIVQGNVAPDGIMILSWPDSAFFRVLNGEPAMTLVPNLLVSGVLAILASLVFLVWVTMFVQRRHGGLVLLLLSLVMLLVGGGFGPPLLGLILGVTATRLRAPLPWWRTHLPRGGRRALSMLWPWLFGASLIAWLALLPGSVLVDSTVGLPNPDVTVAALTLSAFGSLLLTILAAVARDSERRLDGQPAPATRG